jgi:hypothetical protein
MRLLDRQVRLLEYLTSGSVIAGAGSDAPLDQTLHGIDRRLLRLEAQFSHQKRMEKIKSVFPLTFRLLGRGCETLDGEFARAFPPTDVGRIENALQFYDFLRGRWQKAPPVPPYLEDVAACEFAIARVRSGKALSHAEPLAGKTPRLGSIRRHPEVVLLRCGYDIRPIFEETSRGAVPARRDTLLAIGLPADAAYPRICETSRPVFRALGILDDWTDRSELGTTSEVDALVDELARHGLVEVHA